jgi:hypothetical protein
MPTNVEADVEVQKFAFVSDDTGNRLVFPHAHTSSLEGKSGTTGYGATECTFDELEGRLGALRWSAETASIGGAWLRDAGGRFEIVAGRIEMPHGLMLVRAGDVGGESRLEVVSPHVSLSEVRITVKGPFGRSTPAVVTPPPAPSQTSLPERLRFFDSLSGHINLTLKVQLDLPVVGVRTLDQELKVPITEGSLDFRALDESLDWLEGAFLDIHSDEHQLKVRWKVPIFGSSHDLITWQLDKDASALAAFGRVPVRALADFSLGSGSKPDPKEKKRQILRSFSVEDMDLALSLLAPRNLDVGGGLIAFGGEDQPGMVDFKVTGAIRDSGAGAIKGAIGSIDTTIKDLRMGPIELTSDRLHLDGLDHLEVAFDGFTPTSVTVVVHRVTATNLSVKIGS